MPLVRSEKCVTSDCKGRIAAPPNRFSPAETKFQRPSSIACRADNHRSYQGQAYDPFSFQFSVFSFQKPLIQIGFDQPLESKLRGREFFGS